jgi:hypothetical protein
MPATPTPVHYESRIPLTSATHPTPQNVTPSRTTPRNATPVRHITPRGVTPARRTSHGSARPKRRVGSGREGATDVWGFFEAKGGKQICSFCW